MELLNIRHGLGVSQNVFANRMAFRCVCSKSLRLGAQPRKNSTSAQPSGLRWNSHRRWVCHGRYPRTYGTSSGN